jgi:endoribonuclease Dicer
LHDEAVQGDGNGIIVLPTGTGKTRVAFEVIKTALLRHEDRAVVFLCPNVNLVAQQAESFERKFLPTASGKLKRRVVVGQAADGSGKAELAKLSRAAGRADAASFVLFATSGTFCAFLNQNAEALERVFGRLSLLVLDECHHANRMEDASASGETNDDYAQIMRDFYRAVAPSRRPKVIGLTASPGETDADIERLGEILIAQIFQPTAPPALVAELEEQTQSTTTNARLIGDVSDTPARQPLLKTLRRVDRHKRTFARKIQSKDDEEEIRGLTDCVKAAELFRSIGWGGCLAALRASTNVGADYGPEFEKLDAFAQATNRAPPGESPLLQAVKSTLVESVQLPGNPLRAIVFVASIDAAKLMQRALNTFDERIQAKILTGQKELTKAQQCRRVQRFHEGEFNVLVATSVAEEGVDIQACNLVVRTEPPTSIIRNIQGRGRARRAGARYVVMCLDESEVDEMDRLRRREHAATETLKAFVLRHASCGQGAGADGSAVLPTQTSWSTFAASVSVGTRASGVGTRARGGGGGGDASSKPPFDCSADYKSKLNLHFQRMHRPHNAGEYAGIEYTNHTPTGPPHLRMFTATVSFAGKGPYKGEPCTTKVESHKSAAWRALQAV